MGGIVGEEGRKGKRGRNQLSLTVVYWITRAARGRSAPVATGQPLPTVVPIILTALWCVLFTAVAVWRFGREGF